MHTTATCERGIYGVRLHKVQKRALLDFADVHLQISLSAVVLHLSPRLCMRQAAVRVGSLKAWGMKVMIASDDEELS